MGVKRPEYQQRISHFLSSAAALRSPVAVTRAASGGSGQYLGRSSPLSRGPAGTSAHRSLSPAGAELAAPRRRRFPAASRPQRQRGPADQLRPHNPGLISGIQATDEQPTRGPEARGTRERARAPASTARAPAPAQNTARQSKPCWHPTTSW